MKAFRYITRISEEGIIRIPLNPQLLDQEVEVIILSRKKTASSNKKLMKASAFIEKYSGFLTDTDIDGAKLEYLNTKHK